MLTRNFYNIGFTPADILMNSYVDWNCSFIPLRNADKKKARTILNTDGKRIISNYCDVTEDNEDESSKMPKSTYSKSYSRSDRALYPFMLTTSQLNDGGSGVRTYIGLKASNNTTLPKLNSDQFKTGYTEQININGYLCNAFIILGSGNTSPTINDYKLENCNLDYLISNYNQSYNSLTQIANVSITIVPNNDGDIVNEIGVYTMNTESDNSTGSNNASIITSDTSMYKNCCCMIARSVLDNPITLEANKPYTFTYTIDYGRMTDRVA